jgi:hypothetical protein
MTPGPRSVRGVNHLTNSNSIRMSKNRQDPVTETAYLARRVLVTTDPLPPVVAVPRSIVRGGMFKQPSTYLWKN